MRRRTARCGEVICNADQADRQAGRCYREGDHGAALDFLQIARLLDPARAAVWDQREARVRAAMPARVTVREHGSSEYVSFHRDPATGPAAGQLGLGLPPRRLRQRSNARSAAAGRQLILPRPARAAARHSQQQAAASARRAG